MDLSEYAVLLRKRWRSMLAILAATLLAAVLATFLLTPRYTASSQLFFAVPGGESVAELAQGSAFTEQQMGSFVQAARSALVLDRVADELGLAVAGRDLARSIDVRTMDKTTVLEIRATDPDPARAADIANAVAAELGTATAELTPARPGRHAVGRGHGPDPRLRGRLAVVPQPARQPHPRDGAGRVPGAHVRRRATGC